LSGIAIKYTLIDIAVFDYIPFPIFTVTAKRTSNLIHNPYRIHKIPQLDHDLSQLIPIYIPTLLLQNIVNYAILNRVSVQENGGWLFLFSGEHSVQSTDLV